MLHCSANGSISAILLLKATQLCTRSRVYQVFIFLRVSEYVHINILSEPIPGKGSLHREITMIISA